MRACARVCVPIGSTQTIPSTQKCTCGRKKGTVGRLALQATGSTAHVAHVQHQERACTNLCHCNIENPNGKCSTETATPTHKRRRSQHTNQTIPLKGRTDATFMQKAGEKVNIGKFTTFEFFLVSALSKKLEGDDSSDKTICKYIRVVQALSVHPSTNTAPRVRHHGASTNRQW